MTFGLYSKGSGEPLKILSRESGMTLIVIATLVIETFRLAQLSPKCKNHLSQGAWQQGEVSLVLLLSFHCAFIMSFSWARDSAKS